MEIIKIVWYRLNTFCRNKYVSLQQKNASSRWSFYCIQSQTKNHIQFNFSICFFFLFFFKLFCFDCLLAHNFNIVRCIFLRYMQNIQYSHVSLLVLLWLLLWMCMSLYFWYLFSSGYHFDMSIDGMDQERQI